jgi:SAM-dependent methyltransferase
VGKGSKQVRRQPIVKVGRQAAIQQSGHMSYAENYERCCLKQAGALERVFMRLMTRKAEQIGQSSHKIWSLKYLIDNYFSGRSGLRVLDCGAWNGWFLSYNIPEIAHRIALDFDPYYAHDLVRSGMRFVLADMEKGALPLAGNSIDLLAMTSTLEHLSCPEHIAREIQRVLKPGGLAFITVPNILKYGFRFWDDITHKRPFNEKSLRFLFETHGLKTVELCPYNHNLFIAGIQFPAAVHRFMTRFRADALMYIGRKPVS